MSNELMTYGGGGSDNLSSQRSVVEEQVSSREMAEVQAKMIIAQKFPRDVNKAIDRIMNDCCRKSLAENAVYEYKRGATSISGASIRLAEAIVAQWGHIKYGWRELEQSNGVSLCEAYAWDMQSNTYVDRQFKVPHVRETTDRNTREKIFVPVTSPRDIYEMCANNAARRVRACILSVVPADVVEEALKQCEKTLKNTSDVTPENLAKLTASFKEYGVTKKMIEQRIQRNIDSMTPTQLAKLRTVYASLRDGIGNVEDYFTVETVDAVETTTASATSIIEKMKKKGKPDKVAEPVKDDPISDAEEVPPVKEENNPANVEGEEELPY